MNKIDEIQKQLQAPGAGIPKREQKVGGFLFKMKCRLSDRESLAQDFRTEEQKVLSLVEGLPTEVGQERVLISRIRGIEDSSRYWSPYMTVEHLNIVNSGILLLIKSLMAGREMERQVRIEDVKPTLEAGPDQIEKFVKLCDHYQSEIEGLEGLEESTETSPHPWFGPLTACQWNTLATIHMGIHRRQIEKILR